MATYTDGSIVYEVSLDTKNLLQNSGKVREQLLKLNDNGEIAAKGLNKVESSAAGAGNSLGKLTTVAKAVSAALVSSQIIAYAQSWNELEDRIGNTGATALQTKAIMDQLLETSNRNGRTIEESSELYIRLSNSMKELGYSTNNTLDYIDTLSNLMTINKTNALSAQSAISALTKAQMAGKLAGENANSVFNAMPSILKALGSQLNKTETEVRKMATDGQLSMKIFSDAMIGAQGETAKFADNMRNTVNDGITRVTNNLKQYLGELNNSTGATKLLVDSLVLVSQHIDVLVNGLGILAAIYAGKYITSLAAATKQSAEKVIADIRQAAAEKTLAQSALQHAQAEKANALAAQKSLTAQLELAQTERTRNAIRGQLRSNTIALTAATNTEAAAQVRLSAAMKASSFAVNGLKSAMSLLGGPAGILLIAAGALMSWSSSNKEAEERALNLKSKIDDLRESFKSLSEVQMKAKKVDLKEELSNVSEQIKSTESDIESLKSSLGSELGKAFNGFRSVSDDKIQDMIDKLNAKLETLQGNESNVKSLLSDINKYMADAASATGNLADSTGKLNEAFSKDTTDNITKNIEKLSQETEIAELKQKGLTKQSYIYQGALSVLGDESGKYKASLLGLIQGTANLADMSEEQVKVLQPLIDSLSKMYDLNNTGAAKTNNAATKMKELKDNIAIAKLEVAGYIDKAKELKALQEAKSTGGNQSEISNIIALTQEYEKLQLAKSGESFAKDQVNNGLTEAQKIAVEQQAKIDELNKWYETGLADEQLYQDALTAIVEDANQKRKKIDDDTANTQKANMQAILSSTSDLFGGMADLIGNFSNNSGAAYKSMFALSKGFAVANAALNLQSALMQAMADPTALTPAQKFANYAAVAAAGGGLLSQISSISYGGGREHGGTVDANSMYRVGEGGKPEILMSGGRQYMIPGENGRVISNKDIGAASSGVNVVINNYGNDNVETSQSSDNSQMIIDIAAKRGAEMGYKKVSESISSHTGAVWNSLTQNTNTKAKL